MWSGPVCWWDAWSSHSAHLRKFVSILNALRRAEIAEIAGIAEWGSRTSELAEAGKLATNLADSEESPLQMLSEMLVDSHSEVSNVKIEDNKFQCKECGAVWDPERWETSLAELGLVAYQY